MIGSSLSRSHRQDDDATAILARLHEPGRTLLFCDDTDIPRASIENFARDVRVLCAIVMPSDIYSTLVTQMEKRLTELGQTEFHATEIVNPKSTSSWSKVSVADRLGALRLLRDLLSNANIRVLYVHVSKSQFEELRKAAERLGEDVEVGHRAGLKRVFLRSILERLDELGDNPILVLDQSKSLDQAQIEHIAGGEHLFGGGPIVATSEAVAGLQLADMARVLNRPLPTQTSIDRGGNTHPGRHDSGGGRWRFRRTHRTFAAIANSIDRHLIRRLGPESSLFCSFLQVSADS